MYSRMYTGILIIAVAVSCLLSPGRACGSGRDYVDASSTALSYTVSLDAESKHGSGFIIKEGGNYYVITHLSMVKKAKMLTAKTADGKEYEAELRGSSPSMGLAVLWLVGIKGPLTAAKYGRSARLEVGEKVLAVGRNTGYGICVTSGIVSNIRREDTGDGQDLHYIMTDAPINQGQMGAPLVNLEGEVVGMCTVFGGKDIPQSAVSKGLNFAVPIDPMRDAIKQIIRLGGSPATLRDFGFVGLQDISRTTMKKYNLRSKEGALVRGVKKDSPAAMAGIRGGNVILEFNGKTVKDAARLKALIESTQIGSKVSVRYVGMRGRKPVINKTTIELPEPKDDDISNDEWTEEDEVVARAPSPAAVFGAASEAVPVASASGHAAEYVNPIIRAASRVIRLKSGGSAVVIFKNVGSDGANTRYLVSTARIIGKKKTVKMIFYKKVGNDLEPVLVEGKVVGTDVKSDIAVIKIVVRGAPNPISCEDISRLEYGTKVLAVGAVWNGSPIVTAGVVSMKNQRPQAGFIREFCATTAKVVRGNDGGALIDLFGKFAGLCTSLGNYGEKTGMSYVIPADIVREVAREIIVKGKAKSGFLGLDASRNLNKDEKKEYEIGFGVMVLKVVESSPADKAGLKEGQIILKFDGDTVRNVEYLKALVSAARIGEKSPVVIIDTDGQQKTLEVKIIEKE